MPLYEYKCGVCAHRFEIIQKFSDPPLNRCPQCGGPATKLQSAPAFQFKGTGWYVTDYAKKGQDSESPADGGAKDAEAGGAEKTEKADKPGQVEKSAKSETADTAGGAPKTESKAAKSADAPASAPKKSEGPTTKSDR